MKYLSPYGENGKTSSESMDAKYVVPVVIYSIFCVNVAW